MRIPKEIRKIIADQFVANEINWAGRLTDANFLSRIFDLQGMPSYDERYQSAFADIQTHTYNFNDWERDWVFSDNRFDLYNCKDEVFEQFLCEILSPTVRPNDKEDETELIIKIINANLKICGLRISPEEVDFGKPNYNLEEIDIASNITKEKTKEIQEILDSQYISKKLESLSSIAKEDASKAIGESKELVESVCKTILLKKGIEIDKDWQLMKLVKVTAEKLTIIPTPLKNKEAAERSTNQFLKGMSSSIHALAELRNSFGSGHGHDSKFQQLEERHAKLCIGFSTELCRFFLNSYKNEIE